MKTAEEILNNNDSFVKYYDAMKSEVLSMMEEYANQFKQTQPVSTEVEEGSDNMCFHECPDCNNRCNCNNQPCSCCPTPSVKEEVKTTDFEREAEELYPFKDRFHRNPLQEIRAAHIKASQLHCTDGLGELIEFIEKNQYAIFPIEKILKKAKEIKALLNK